MISKLPHGRVPAQADARWCVKDRHADGRTVHRHFARKDEAENFVIAAARRADRRRRRRAAHDRDVRGSTPRRGARRRRGRTRAAPATRSSGPTRSSAPSGSRAIDGLMLQTLQRKLFEHPYKRATVEQTMHFVKAALRQAHADRLIADDPTTRVRLPRRDSLDRNGIVTADQVPTTSRGAGDHRRRAASRYRAGGRARPRLRAARRRGARADPVAGRPGGRDDHDRPAVAAGPPRLTEDVARRPHDRAARPRDVRAAPAVRAGPAPELPMFAGRRGGGAAPRRVLRARRGGRRCVGRRARRATATSSTRARHYAVSSMLGRGRLARPRSRPTSATPSRRSSTTYSALPARVRVAGEAGARPRPRPALVAILSATPMRHASL